MATSSQPIPLPDDRKLIAPLWHTILFIGIMVGLSLLQAKQQPKMADLHMRNRVPLYVLQMIFELLLVAYMWLLGLRRTGTRLRDLIGGKWSSASDVLRDIRVALVFWIVVAVMLVAMAKLLGKNTGDLGAMKALLPQTPVEMVVWVILSTTAGFCEEIVFRGYFQRQFFALTGRNEVAVILQALIFGMGHVYQGGKNAITIAVYGALFGILAVRQKSLRPGMIQHAAQDSFSGVVGSLLAKRHYF